MGRALNGLPFQPRFFGHCGLGPGLTCLRWQGRCSCHIPVEQLTVAPYPPPITALPLLGVHCPSCVPGSEPPKAELWGQQVFRVPWAWQGWQLTLSSPSQWGPGLSAWRCAAWPPPRHRWGGCPPSASPVHRKPHTYMQGKGENQAVQGGMFTSLCPQEGGT